MGAGQGCNSRHLGFILLWSQIENGYFVHYFAPEGLPTIPKNVIFVIDKSGSMRGKKIQQVGPVGQGRALKTPTCLTPSALVQQADPPSYIFLGRGLPGFKVGQSVGQILPLEHSPCPNSRCRPSSTDQGHMSKTPLRNPPCLHFPCPDPGSPNQDPG